MLAIVHLIGNSKFGVDLSKAEETQSLKVSREIVRYGLDPNSLLFKVKLQGCCSFLILWGFVAHS